MLDFKKLYEEYAKEYQELEPRIANGTEKYRKSNATIQIVDKNNCPQKNMKVKIKQNTHDFKFGCNVLNLGQLGEHNKIYEEKILNLFNLVTTTVCWDAYEPEPGKYNFVEGECESPRRPALDRVRKFAKENHIDFKGQPMIADSWVAKWASKDTETLKKQYINFFEKISERYGDDLYLIDVVNEAYSIKERTPDFPLYTEDLSFRNWAFQEARRIFPKKVKLNYNEGSQVNGGAYAEQFFNDVKNMLDSGCGLDSCSFQFHLMTAKRNGGDGALAEHLKRKYNSPKEIYNVYNKFSTLNIPLYISEMTVATRDTGLNVSLGEKIQANIIEDLYRLWFSIPKMEGIIFWNLVDGHAFGGESSCLGCLLDQNYYEKPSYQRLYQLINREWKTNLNTVTDDNGCIDFRGYHGDYSVFVTKIDGSEEKFDFSLHKGENNKRTYSI